MPVETKGIVNNNDSPKRKTWHEIVNNRESLGMVAQLNFVNTNKEGQKMKNHFEGNAGELDQWYVPFLLKWFVGHPK